MNVVRITAPAICVAALLGCSHGHEAQTTVTGAVVGAVPNSTAASRIADSRCQHELACHNIGPDEDYISNDACVQKTHADLMTDLNVNDCPAGVDERQLEACVATIGAQSCKNVFDKMEKNSACRTHDLCLTRPKS